MTLIHTPDCDYDGGDENIQMEVTLSTSGVTFIINEHGVLENLTESGAPNDMQITLSCFICGESDRYSVRVKDGAVVAEHLD